MDLREAITKQTGFSLKLAQKVASDHAAGSNLVFSPLSLHAVLGLVAAGSGGATRDQIVDFLGSESLDELNSLASQLVAVALADGSTAGGPRLAAANGAWVDASIQMKPSFKEIVTSTYKAEATTVDFRKKAQEVAEQVNSWVENVTSGLIKDLLPPQSVNCNTRLILANALYFKGLWETKFDAAETQDSDFHLLNGCTTKAPFMSSTEKQYISSHDSFKVLRLPYKQGGDARRFSMYIFLPDARDGLWSLSEKMASVSGFLDDHRPMRKVRVRSFKLPRFKVKFGFEASEVLKGLGVVLPFSSDADLTEMVDPPAEASGLYVSSIFHKAFVEVNEEGTEAAAASAIVMMKCSLSRDVPVDFVADRPFLFLIREDLAGAVLFVGHVLDPSVDG